MITFAGLENSFDNDQAEEMLNLHIGKMTHTSQFVRKSIYDFDLNTPEGIEKLMALLPIMDPEILVDIMQEIWPGYPTEVNARRHRLEIKGYLKDYLENYDAENADEQSEGFEGPGGPEEAPGAEGQEADQLASAENTQNTEPGSGTPGNPAAAPVPPQSGAAKQAPVAPPPGA